MSDAGPGADLAAAPDEPAAAPDAFADVKQLGMIPALTSLSYVFWIVGAMEMVERLAFYGVIGVRGLYGTAAVEKGGLGVSPASFAWISSATWMPMRFTP